jgi:predicted aldo/keto reductase-like oxidoreductase
VLTRINEKNGDELSILGFGCMKLPTNGSKGNIDEPRAIAMIRKAIDEGVNYFDTAYVYHNGKSEGLLGKALEGGYRDRVKIATKLPPFIVRSLEGAKKIFATQLERLKTDFIDYYLLHMLTEKARFDYLAGLGILEWLEELKAAGTIKNIGFSFHGTREEFEKIIREYPWDFCQIQYNYIDENNQAGKTGLKLAAEMGIPVIVMEPLRGGKLVNHLPEKVAEAFAAYDNKRSPAEWALRWVWNHPEVTVVLSGMSNEAQIAENIRIACDARPDSLSGEELKIFDNAKALLTENTKIPCTSCGYCVPCPHGVDIPGCFSCYNDRYLISKRAGFMEYYKSLGALSARPATASACVECGKCEIHCPQNIPIRLKLKLVEREMGGFYMKPVLGIARKLLRIK